MGLFWRCKWFQMAEEAEGGLQPYPKGVQWVRICDRLIRLYPTCKLFAKSDIYLQSTGVDIKSYQVNTLIAQARGFGDEFHEGNVSLIFHSMKYFTDTYNKSSQVETVVDGSHNAYTCLLITRSSPVSISFS